MKKGTNRMSIIPENSLILRNVQAQGGRNAKK